MPPLPEVSDDELIIRRILPNIPSCQRIKVEGGKERLTSTTVQPRKDKITQKSEEYISFSCASITTSERLLAQAGLPPEQMTGASVWGISVADVKKIDDGTGKPLCVLFCPTDEDPGHCGVFSHGGKPFPPGLKKVQQALAKAMHKVYPL